MSCFGTPSATSVDQRARDAAAAAQADADAAGAAAAAALSGSANDSTARAEAKVKTGAAMMIVATAARSVPAAVTKIVFDAVLYATGPFAGQVLSNSQITIPVACRFRITTRFRTPGTATERRTSYARHYGSDGLHKADTAVASITSHTGIGVSRIMTAAAGDYIDMVCGATASTTTTIVAGVPEYVSLEVEILELL